MSVKKLIDIIEEEILKYGFAGEIEETKRFYYDPEKNYKIMLYYNEEKDDAVLVLLIYDEIETTVKDGDEKTKVVIPVELFICIDNKLDIRQYLVITLEELKYSFKLKLNGKLFEVNSNLCLDKHGIICFKSYYDILESVFNIVRTKKVVENVA